MQLDNLRVAITGVSGRMGRSLIKEIVNFPNTILSVAICKKNSDFFGIDVGKLIGINDLGVTIHDNIEIFKDAFDVLIDFTNPKSSLYYLDFCRKYNKNIIIGTTGFNEEEKKIISNVAKKEIGIVFSANFSIGINIMLKLLEKITKVLGQNTDIEIIDIHHKNKIDVPSGTAISMGKIISKVLEMSFKKYNISCQKINNKNIKNNNVGFSSIRTGNIIGEHSVMFTNSEEQLKITHKSYDRTVFAKGALYAAKWIVKYKKGLFNMLDVLNLNNL